MMQIPKERILILIANGKIFLFKQTLTYDEI